MQKRKRTKAKKKVNKLYRTQAGDLTVLELMDVMLSKMESFSFLRADPGDKWVFLINGEPFSQGEIDVDEEALILVLQKEEYT